MLKDVMKMREIKRLVKELNDLEDRANQWDNILRGLGKYEKGKVDGHAMTAGTRALLIEDLENLGVKVKLA